MRRTIASVVFGGALLISAASLGAEITGTIKAIDLAKMEVAMENGDVYIIADINTVDGFAPGDAVAGGVANAQGGGATVQSLRKIEAPMPAIDWSPIYPDKNVKVVFDASRSYDPDGEIVRYSWDFGDGGVAEGKVVEHKYKDGYFRVWLTVEDNDALVRKQKLDLPVTETWRP